MLISITLIKKVIYEVITKFINFLNNAYILTLIK